MKLIILTREAGSPVMQPPGLWTVPDSGMVLPGRPLFLPEFSNSWIVSVAVAVKICRLGKTIPRKFASRYYDSVSLVARLEPVELLDTLKLEGKPTNLASSFDNCAQLGTWLPADEILSSNDIAIDFAGLKCRFNAEAIDIDSVIAEVSKYITLRTGDIVCPATIGIDLSVKIGDSLVGSINGQECLSARIK